MHREGVTGRGHRQDVTGKGSKAHVKILVQRMTLGNVKKSPDRLDSSQLYSVLLRAVSHILESDTLQSPVFSLFQELVVSRRSANQNGTAGILNMPVHTLRQSQTALNEQRVQGHGAS